MPVSRPSVPRAERVAVVLDEEQVVLGGERGDRIEIERVAERVREHDRARPRADRLREPIDPHVVGAELDVDEHRHEPVEHDRVHGGGESGRDREHLVARAQPAIAELG